MNAKEKIMLQGEMIAELQQQLEDEKTKYELLQEEYNELKKTKDEIELELAETGKEMRALVDQFHHVTSQITDITKGYERIKREYKKVVERNEKKMNDLFKNFE